MNVLIIQTAFIGDVVLCTPLIASLHKHGHSVGFVLKPEAANILETDERLTDLFIYDKRGNDKGIGGFLRLKKQIAEKKYDAVLIPHRSIRSAALARLSGIPVRIGFDKSAGSMFFTHKIAYKQNIHEIERNNSLLPPLGIKEPPVSFSIQVSEDDIKTAEKFLSDNELKEDDKLIGFGPGSQWSTKQWGIERFRKLAQLLTENNFKVVCFGSAGEKDLCEKVSDFNHISIINAAGYLTIRQSSALMRPLKAVISNDNGLTHIAAASGKRVITIFGPTIPEFGFAPWGEDHIIVGKDLYCRPCGIHGSNKCREKHFRCMNEITAEEVFEAVKKITE
ncbi:glycosyltransferase family 9 protein [candidate division KSB1 bacterium]